jgi:conjugative transposon TraM protein
LKKSVSVDQTNTVMAVIHENQKLQDGQTIKFRLLQNIYVKNSLIPKGSFVFGRCRLSEGRVNVAIPEITYNNSVYPVQLTVYDQTDGMEGINVQGNITEEVSKDGMDQLIQQMQYNTMTSSLGVQAATSGIQTAKNLLSKKIKRQTVNLKAGHIVLLKQQESN